MKTTPTLTLLRDVEVRLVQIASGDYKTCGVFAEDVARDAIPAIQELVRRAGDVDDDWDEIDALVRYRICNTNGINIEFGEDADRCVSDILMDLRPHLVSVASGWMPIEHLTSNEYVLLYSAKGFFEPNENYQVGTREQWHKTATHFQPLPQPPKKD